MSRIKSGWKTTEFWLTSLAAVAALIMNSLPETDPVAKIATAIVAGLAAVGYTAGRAVAKGAQALTE